MALGDLDSYMQKMKLENQLTPYTKINSRGIKALNISRNTMKVLEENIGRKIRYSTQQIFTDMYPKTRDIKERMSKRDFIRLKSF